MAVRDATGTSMPTSNNKKNKKRVDGDAGLRYHTKLQNEFQVWSQGSRVAAVERLPCARLVLRRFSVVASE